MTFSVTKTFLSTVVGLAWQKGLIRDVTDKARDYMPPGVDLFDEPHNQPITWEHLLRQTSDWNGTLWGKPDWADRPEGKPEEWSKRPLHAPGTRYKYNDVRVNVLALARAARPAAAAARCPARGGDGADRRLEHVAMARLRQLLDRSRRPQGAVDDRRRPLGRRHVHRRLGHGALRLSVPPQRQAGRTGRSSRSNGFRWPEPRGRQTRTTAT